MIDPFSLPDARRIAIFGHPAHELAIYGLLQRHQPHVIVITDGGGPVRIEQSKAGMKRAGVLDRVTYLNFSEASFYDAMLDVESDLFMQVADRLRVELKSFQPDQIFFDAVEFYNPVHDVTRPMVLNAVEGDTKCSLYEIPLVYQKPAEGELYEIQRVPEAQSHLRFQYHLSPDELESKIYARDNIYANLREQAGPEFLATTPEHLSVEEIADANRPMPDAGSSGRVLRYEWRARLLQEQGVIPQGITYHDHFLPVVTKLTA